MIKAKKIIFPEGSEINILLAAQELVKRGFAKPVLLSQKNDVKKAAQAQRINLVGIEIIEIEDETFRDQIIDKYSKIEDAFSEKRLRLKWKTPLNAAAILIKVGYGDCLIAGIIHATNEVILSALTFIELAENIKIPSSCFVMDVRHSINQLLIFADCAVAVQPTTTELSDIAIASANTAKNMLNWEPRLAFLSSSTYGSGDSQDVEKVQQAVALTKERAPELSIVGEVQLDAAINRQIALKKGISESPEVGIANVLIFPDLDAANIGYKLVQQLCGADAYGPILQGFQGNVCDLSRGATVEDIVGTSIIACGELAQL